MNQLLQIIGEAHVLRAALNLLANPVPGMEEPRSWAVSIEGHVFPTKALVKKAYCYAAGIDYQNLPAVFNTASFTTQIAIATLGNLGFPCYRI